MRRAALIGVCVAALAAPLWANAPERSLRPEVRPALTGVEEPSREAVAAPDGSAPLVSLRPPLRPFGTDSMTATAPDALPFGGLFASRTGLGARVIGGTSLAARVSLRPEVRPAGLVARIRAAEARAEAAATQARADAEARSEATRQTPSRVAQTTVSRGRLCGVRGLYGDELEPISGRISGCGIEQPVRLREVDGITLTQPATINCRTAEAVQTWLRDAAVPAVGRRGGGIASLRVVASYACRTRNSRPGARLSEHALGNAIDIAAINLNDGSAITVLQGWRDRRDGPILRAMHQGACGTFGTVLGPESDRFHQDHFHFDVASYRSGAYCR